MANINDSYRMPNTFMDTRGQTSDYEQRLQNMQSERNKYDASIGFKSQNNNQQQQQIHNQIVPAGNVHPSLINMYMNMEEIKRDLLKRTDPNLYASINLTLEKMQQSQQQQPPQQQSQQQSQQSPDDTGPNHNHNHNYSANPNNAERIDTRNYSNTLTIPLSIDFRNNLIDCNKCEYRVSFNKINNVKKITLESSIISQIYNLENEPYIYLCLNNIKGDYDNNDHNIFGKLIVKKLVNGFIHYKPENCTKTFRHAESFNFLGIILLNHEYKRIFLNSIPISKIKKTQHHLIITSSTDHYLSINDKINIINTNIEEVIVYTMKILELKDKLTFVIDLPKIDLSGSPNIIIEKVDIKMTLSFKCELLDI